MTEAIFNFPTPTDIRSIRSWFGLANQVSYAFSQAEAMAPFRELLRKKDRKLYWDATLNELSEKSKLNIVRKIEKGFKTFEMDRAIFGISFFKKTADSVQNLVLTVVRTTVSRFQQSQNPATTP